MKKLPPKLPLTPEERLNLRKFKIRLAQIAELDSITLSQLLHISVGRAKTLISLAAFQAVPDIGPQLAKNLVDLGYYSLEELKGQDGARLIEQLEELYGVWIDPCAEDCLRKVVHYAENPGSHKRWWDFTDERKAYREQFGYPDTRPTKAWNDPTP